MISKELNKRKLNNTISGNSALHVSGLDTSYNPQSGLGEDFLDDIDMPLN
jgi:hypothetical protein